MKQAADRKQPTTREPIDAVNSVSKLGYALFDIGWRLAVVVIGGLWLGAWADRHFGTKPVFILIAFVLIIASFVLIVRRVLQSLPKEYGGLQK